MTDTAGTRPALVVVGGLPATGKSTIAGTLARLLRCAYLRIDTIEQAIVSWSTLTQPLGAVGYAVGYQLAGEQLRLGLSVVAESVNPLAITRDAWRDVGLAAAATVVEVEVVCSDPAEHRRRAETRRVDVPDLKLPSWQDICDREYEAWTRDHLVLDTALLSVEQSVLAIRNRLGR